MATQALVAAIDYVSVSDDSQRGPTMPEIITANRLADGDVVYRTAAGDWVRDVNAAEVLDEPARKAEAEAAAAADVKASKVLDLATITVEVSEGRVVPKRLRERIRAFGPTVKSDHRPGADQSAI